MSEVGEYSLVPIETDGLVMFSRRETCPFCFAMLEKLQEVGFYPQIVYAEDVKPLFKKTHATVPQLYYKGSYRGDFNTVASLRTLYTSDKKFKEELLGT